MKMRMSYRYTTTKELVKGHNTSSINLMKVVGTFVKLEGMNNHSNRPYLDLKVVFHTLVGPKKNHELQGRNITQYLIFEWIDAIG
jgi:hypothetical protein